MMLQEVFEQTGCNGRPDIFIFVRAPFQHERPDKFWLAWYEGSNLDNGLPSWILGAFRSRSSRKKPFSMFECLKERHVAFSPFIRFQPVNSLAEKSFPCYS